MLFSGSLAAFVLLQTACDTTKKAAQTRSDDGKISMTFLQINDVYEISPLEKGTVGGLARVATLRTQLKAENPNTVTIMAGDFYSPSVLGTLKVEGKRLRGKQMVDVLNVMGLDLATFGNHEFDIKEEEVQERLDESKFAYVSTNVQHKMKDKTAAFEQNKTAIPEIFFLEQHDADGTTVKIGVLGVTLPFNKAPFVAYEDVRAAYQGGYERIKNNCDFVVAITHLNIADDLALAKEFPEIQLLMGGHDHNHQIHQVGKVTVAKADANAKTAYIHRLNFDKKTKKLSIASELKSINATLKPDAATAAVVEKWETIGRKNFAELGFAPDSLVFYTKTPLDGREQTIRAQAAPLLQIIAQSMLSVSPSSEIAVLNSGSVRIDDIVQGSVTEYDVIRMLPFGGSIAEVEMKGSLLKQMMDIGTTKNIGLGGFLQTANIEKSAQGTWLINAKPLDENRIYKLAIGDFLMTGGEANLDFLKTGNADILSIKNFSGDKNDIRRDVRLAFIQFCRAEQAKIKGVKTQTNDLNKAQDTGRKKLESIFGR
jgi:2',3'-cyclic-nucleotide 2'-phosphodiesterase (5'-nucleotidase family)